MFGTTTGRTTGRLDAVAAISPRRIAALTLLLIAMAQPAEAQFGGLKRLKKALSRPDSAVQATDSAAKPVAPVAQVAAGAPATQPAKSKGSFFSRAASAVGNASNKMENATGISMKDAAMAASGVGVAGLVARKAGLTDPGGLAGNALKNATGNALQQGMGAGSGGISGALSNAVSGGVMSKLGMPTSRGALPSAAVLNSAMAGNAMSGNAMMGGLLGKTIMGNAMGKALSSAGVGTPADAAAMLAFQQAMMQAAMAASSGDATARARLDAWQAIALKYQGKAAGLTAAAEAGDLTAVMRLQEMQLAMIREWAGVHNLHPGLAKP